MTEGKSVLLVSRVRRPAVCVCLGVLRGAPPSRAPRQRDVPTY